MAPAPTIASRSLDAIIGTTGVVPDSSGQITLTPSDIDKLKAKYGDWYKDLLTDAGFTFPPSPYKDYTKITPVVQAQDGRTIYWGEDKGGNWVILYDPSDLEISRLKEPPTSELTFEEVVYPSPETQFQFDLIAGKTLSGKEMPSGSIYGGPAEGGGYLYSSPTEVSRLIDSIVKDTGVKPNSEGSIVLSQSDIDKLNSKYGESQASKMLADAGFTSTHSPAPTETGIASKLAAYTDSQNRVDLEMALESKAVTKDELLSAGFNKDAVNLAVGRVTGTMPPQQQFSLAQGLGAIPANAIFSFDYSTGDINYVEASRADYAKLDKAFNGLSPAEKKYTLQQAGFEVSGDPSIQYIGLSQSDKDKVLGFVPSVLDSLGTATPVAFTSMVGIAASSASDAIKALVKKYVSPIPIVGPITSVVAGAGTALGAGVLTLYTLPWQIGETGAMSLEQGRISPITELAKGVAFGFGSFVKQAAIGTYHLDPWSMGEMAAIVVPAGIGVTRIGPSIAKKLGVNAPTITGPLGKVMKVTGAVTDTALTAVNAPGWISSGARGLYNRVMPGTMPASTLELIADVVRVEVPKDMGKLAARQLVDDVLRIQTQGTIPAARIRALEDFPGVDSVGVRITPSGAFDVVLNSADGSVMGRVSGSMRVFGDVTYHYTSNAKALLEQIEQGEGKLTVKLTESHTPGLYQSPMPAATMGFRTISEVLRAGKEPSLGIFAIRHAPGELEVLPAKVLDQPTLGSMRAKMNEMIQSGEIFGGTYPLFKGYGSPTKLELEMVSAPGEAFFTPPGKWYARGKVPTTYTTNPLGFEGLGYGVKPGAKIPIYWLATEKALAMGRGVPKLGEMYLSKALGDITKVRRYAPWNLKLRPETYTEEAGGVYSKDMFYSREPVLKLTSAEEGLPGRTSVIVTNSKGEILLSRTQGQPRWDLPGGGNIKGESLEKAGARELYEEVGLETKDLKLTDSFTSTFGKEGSPREFNVLEGTAKGKPQVGGAEIAEYAWWDGKTGVIRSRTGSHVGEDLPVAEFTKEAIRRRSAGTQEPTIKGESARLVKEPSSRPSGEIKGELSRGSEGEGVAPYRSPYTSEYFSAGLGKALPEGGLESLVPKTVIDMVHTSSAYANTFGKYGKVGAVEKGYGGVGYKPTGLGYNSPFAKEQVGYPSSKVVGEVGYNPMNYSPETLPLGYTPLEYMPQGYGPSGYVPQGYKPTGYKSLGYVPPGYVPPYVPPYTPPGYKPSKGIIIPPGGGQKEKPEPTNLALGSLIWQQGDFKRQSGLEPVVKAIEPPYNQERPYTYVGDPDNLLEGKRGTPKETLRIVGGVAPVTAEVDLGVVDIEVKGGSKEIKFKGGGLKTSVGGRGKTSGMRVRRQEPKVVRVT